MTRNNTFISEVKKTFSFLNKDYGFDAPKVEETPWQGFVSFRKRSVAVGIEVAWRDAYVGISLEWPKKGGQTRTARLHELLAERGHKYAPVEKGIKRRKDQRSAGLSAEGVREYLEEQAALLRQYAEDILRG